jgi:hypothetical protein
MSFESSCGPGRGSSLDASVMMRRGRSVVLGEVRCLRSAAPLLRGWERFTIFIDVRRVTRNILLLLLVSLHAGCASTSCPPLGDVMVSVDHVEASDAPTGTTRTVYADGTVQWVDARRRSRCERLPTARLEQIRAAIAAEAFLEEPAHVGHTSHREMIQIHDHGRSRIYLVEELPAALCESMRAVDAAFRDAFGRRYRPLACNEGAEEW